MAFKIRSGKRGRRELREKQPAASLASKKRPAHRQKGVQTIVKKRGRTRNGAVFLPLILKPATPSHGAGLLEANQLGGAAFAYPAEVLLP